MRQEVDDYVDAKLANFEIVLNKTLAAVQRGREKLQGRGEMEQLRRRPRRRDATARRLRPRATPLSRAGIALIRFARVSSSRFRPGRIGVDQFEAGFVMPEGSRRP